MKIYENLAKKISYDDKKRSYDSVKYIVIHYTGNSGDTAFSNASYFANANTRKAGAHYFVDKKGEVWKSVPLNRTAWAVGKDYRSGDGGGKLYGKCTNYNSVSIELCDCVKRTNATQKKAVRDLIRHIRKTCPNATHVVRHWDVNGKACPLPFIGAHNLKWSRFKKYVNK